MDTDRNVWPIKTVYDGVCKECGAILYQGEGAVWDSKERKLYCQPCGQQRIEEEDEERKRGIE